MEITNLVVLGLLAGLMLALAGTAWLWRRPGMLDRLWARLDEQENELEALREELAELREGRIDDHALLTAWIAYARQLAAKFKELTGQEPPPEPHTQPLMRTRRDPARLAGMMAAQFSRDEMDGLAFELGIELTGDTRGERARNLAVAARNRQLIDRLIELCRKERPNGGF